MDPVECIPLAQDPTQPTQLIVLAYPELTLIDLVQKRSGHRQSMTLSRTHIEQLIPALYRALSQMAHYERMTLCPPPLAPPPEKP